MFLAGSWQVLGVFLAGSRYKESLFSRYLVYVVYASPFIRAATGSWYVRNSIGENEEFESKGIEKPLVLIRK